MTYKPPGRRKGLSSRSGAGGRRKAAALGALLIEARFALPCLPKV